MGLENIDFGSYLYPKWRPKNNGKPLKPKYEKITKQNIDSD